MSKDLTAENEKVKDIDIVFARDDQKFRLAYPTYAFGPKAGLAQQLLNTIVQSRARETPIESMNEVQDDYIKLAFDLSTKFEAEATKRGWRYDVLLEDTEQKPFGFGSER